MGRGPFDERMKERESFMQRMWKTMLYLAAVTLCLSRGIHGADDLTSWIRKCGGAVLLISKCRSFPQIKWTSKSICQVLRIAVYTKMSESSHVLLMVALRFPNEGKLEDEPEFCLRVSGRPADRNCEQHWLERGHSGQGYEEGPDSSAPAKPADNLSWSRRSPPGGKRRHGYTWGGTL